MKFTQGCNIAALILPILFQFLDAISSKDAAEKLQERYNNTVEVCRDGNGNTRPAYECSGILIRGTSKNLTYAWSMSPLNIEKKSFSLDQPFSHFPMDYESGSIIYPHLMTPVKKSTFDFFCAFPLNAGTDFRNDHGCGMHFRDKKGISRPCQEQGIDSFEKWMKFFNGIKPVDGHKMLEIKQCAFDLTDASSAAENFNICLEVGVFLHGLKDTEYVLENNEMKIRSWELEKVEKLPIEVFFYILDSKNGLEYAKKYRDDYRYHSNGEMVPIVGIRYPLLKTRSSTWNLMTINFEFSCCFKSL